MQYNVQLALHGNLIKFFAGLHERGGYCDGHYDGALSAGARGVLPFVFTFIRTVDHLHERAILPEATGRCRRLD